MILFSQWRRNQCNQGKVIWKCYWMCFKCKKRRTLKYKATPLRATNTSRGPPRNFRFLRSCPNRLSVSSLSRLTLPQGGPWSFNICSRFADSARWINDSSYWNPFISCIEHVCSTLMLKLSIPCIFVSKYAFCYTNKTQSQLIQILKERHQHISLQVYHLQGEQNVRFKKRLPLESCYL